MEAIYIKQCLNGVETLANRHASRMNTTETPATKFTNAAEYPETCAFATHETFFTK